MNEFKNSPYAKFTLLMTPELEQLLKAIRQTTQQLDQAQRMTEKDVEHITHDPREMLNRMVAAAYANKTRADAALGQYVYRTYDDLIPDGQW